MITITVRQFFEDLEEILSLECIAGKDGFSRKITIPHIQKPGLALTGDTSALNPGRIQIFGNSEIRYLNKLEAKKRTQIIGKICQAELSCLVVTNKNPVPQILKERARKHHIPLFITPLGTATAIIRIQKFLEKNLTESTTRHGVFIDVYGIGVLLLGKSGIGKSECALELVTRGHRLIADDMVVIRKKRPDTVFGTGSEVIKYHMEIRGLGILNIKDLFGVAAVRDSKNVELVIELTAAGPDEDCDRTGLDEQTYELLGIAVPFLCIPVQPGRSLSTIVEVAARNQLLKIKGYYSAQHFQDRITQDLLTGTLNHKKLGL